MEFRAMPVEQSGAGPCGTGERSRSLSSSIRTSGFKTALVTNNSGGLYASGDPTLLNTIVANNTSDFNTSNSCSDPVISEGNNLENGTNCGFTRRCQRREAEARHARQQRRPHGHPRPAQRQQGDRRRRDALPAHRPARRNPAPGSGQRHRSPRKVTAPEARARPEPSPPEAAKGCRREMQAGATKDR
jgi:hypothetical protein